jgi:hypothetical protein
LVLALGLVPIVELVLELVLALRLVLALVLKVAVLPRSITLLAYREVLILNPSFLDCNKTI